MTEPIVEEKPGSAETTPISPQARAETTFVTVIEEPTRGVVVIEEQASVRATSSEEAKVFARPTDVSSDLADRGSEQSKSRALARDDAATRYNASETRRA